MAEDPVERARALREKGKTIWTEGFKDRVYGDLADAMIKALQDPYSDFTVEDSEQSAEVILEFMEKTDNYFTLIFHLTQLKTRWPVYTEACDKYIFPGRK